MIELAILKTVSDSFSFVSQSGTMLPMGTVDVYPGVYGGPYGGSQPGGLFAAMWPGGQLCSHFRYLPTNPYAV